ncbi:MAG: GAF domain-containing sensor histidine kinase [Armatimonadetes bacterium]|nr:GAF domain-containing sensor histidine kinase [Armatimonadota bacterium]
MAGVVQDVPGQSGAVERATEVIAAELKLHLGEIRAAWLAQATDRGLLRQLNAGDVEREADLVLRVWFDFVVREHAEETLMQVQWVAQRSVLAGRSIEDTLALFLTMRDVCRERLLAALGGDGHQIGEVLPQFEELSQRLMVRLAVGCAEERERLTRERMRALVEAGMLLTAEQRLDVILQKIVDLSRSIVGAHYAALAALDEHGAITQLVTSGVDPEMHARIAVLPTGRGILGMALRGPLRLPDVTCDPRALGFPPNHPVMHSFLGVPIASRGKVYGNLYLTEKYDGGEFSAEDETLVATFASQAAAAIQNARSFENLRLLEESRLRERQHSELLQRVIAAQEEERKRVARELHDHTGQSLTSLIIGLRTLDSVQSVEEVRAAIREMRAHAGQALEELHHLAFELRPSVLDDLGLVAALQRYAEDFGRRTGVRMEVELDPPEGARLAPAVEIALYRIVQEALTNVAKHAEAKTASVLLHLRGSSLLLIIEDDGKGFEVPDFAQSEGKHFGLMGMQERVNLLGGKLTVESSPGSGTTVYVEVPLVAPA